MSTSTSKRHRTSSLSSSSSSSASSPNQHTSKASRIIVDSQLSPHSSSTQRPLLCSLPPTCNHRPTPIANTKELESHYAKYHAHVCELTGCGCVFPDARLLELVCTASIFCLLCSLKVFFCLIYALFRICCTMFSTRQNVTTHWRQYGRSVGRKLSVSLFLPKINTYATFISIVRLPPFCVPAPFPYAQSSASSSNSGPFLSKRIFFCRH